MFENLDISAKDLIRLKISRKAFAIIADKKVHLTNNPERIIFEKYPNKSQNKIQIIELK